MKTNRQIRPKSKQNAIGRKTHTPAKRRLSMKRCAPHPTLGQRTPYQNLFYKPTGGKSRANPVIYRRFCIHSPVFSSKLQLELTRRDLRDTIIPAWIRRYAPPRVPPRVKERGMTSGYDGIGRRVGFRFLCPGVWVRVPLSAPTKESTP